MVGERCGVSPLSSVLLRAGRQQASWKTSYHAIKTQIPRFNRAFHSLVLLDWKLMHDIIRCYILRLVVHYLFCLDIILICACACAESDIPPLTACMHSLG